MFCREKRERELELFLKKRYNKVGEKIQERVTHMNNLTIDPDLVLHWPSPRWPMPGHQIIPVSIFCSWRSNTINFIPWISYLGSRHKVIQNLFTLWCPLVGYSWIWRCAVTDEHEQLNNSSWLNLSFFSDQYISRFDFKELSDGLSATYNLREDTGESHPCE